MWRLLASVLAGLVLAVGAASCGGSSTGRTAVIVDTDLSSDDVIALAYLAADPHVDLRAVLVSGAGLVECPVGARRALELLGVVGRPDVPVACGRTKPLEGLHAVPTAWREAADALFGLTLPPSDGKPTPDAVALMVHAIEDAPERPTVVELAPMTNLAAALQARPELRREIGTVVAMAGAISVPGNAPDEPLAETNAWIDPRAARVVAASGVPLTLVPLDATNDVPVTTFFAQALKRSHYATPQATLAWEVVQSSGMDRGGSYFWDPLAAAVALNPSLVTTSQEQLRIDVATGRTTTSPGNATRIAMRADRARFERQLLSTLLDGARFTIPPDRPDVTLALTSSGCRYTGGPALTAGPIVVDTVNRTGTPFGWAIGHLDANHTVADLSRYAAGLTGSTITPPTWFTSDASGSPVPPHSRLTWQAVASLSTTGSSVFVCATFDPVRIWLPAVVPVFGSR